MLIVEIVLAAVVVFGVAVVAVGYGGSITHFTPDWPGHRLPEGRTLRADDIATARFSLAVRGYRMSEVDEALDRLAVEIAERDARIEQLTGRPYEAPAPPADGYAAPSAPFEQNQQADDASNGHGAGDYPTSDYPTSEFPPYGYPPAENPHADSSYAENPNPYAQNPYAPPRPSAPEPLDSDGR